MNIWVDKLSDMRLSLNDLYMILLMTGWMFFFMGIIYTKLYTFIFGLCLVLINLWCIRTQFMISTKQYILGMIPHHSMAIHMSKKLLQNQESNIKDFANNIILQQKKEIDFMKHNI